MNATPIVYIVFNRPWHTSITFNVIKKLKPKYLFIIADGPRSWVKDDIKKCEEVREIVNDIDWDCDVKRLYAEENIGLKARVSSGLDWVFEQVEEAIILEDDCLPNMDFFRFCNELLVKYKKYESIHVITGNNFQDGKIRGDGSYFLSKYNHCWGWATWRRAWKNFDKSIKFWDEWKASETFKNLISDPIERGYWTLIFEKVYRGEINSWAYPWTASVWHKGGMTIMPNVNLVSNIGFGEFATHTKSSKSKQANVPSLPLDGKIAHPSKLIIDEDADAYNFNHAFGGKYMRWPYKVIIMPRKISGKIKRKLLDCLRGSAKYFGFY